jgi:hypothetical protein
MKILRILILAFSTFSFLSTYGQEAQIYFDKIENILKSENLSTNLSNKLDSLKSKHIPSRSNFNNYLDRDLDFGCRHQRINLEINFEQFQIDLLKKNDTILVASLTTENYKKLKFSQVDTPKTAIYLKERNKFYKSSKTTIRLLDELSLDEMFAFYCGDGAPKTEKGFEIEKLVEDEKIDELTQMLKSICVETQAYGVAGFEMLVRQGYALPTDISRLITHIKKRNSETIICSGCFAGIVEKLYNKK